MKMNDNYDLSSDVVTDWDDVTYVTYLISLLTYNRLFSLSGEIIHTKYVLDSLEYYNITRKSLSIKWQNVTREYSGNINNTTITLKIVNDICISFNIQNIER